MTIDKIMELFGLPAMAATRLYTALSYVRERHGAPTLALALRTLAQMVEGDNG